MKFYSPLDYVRPQTCSSNCHLTLRKKNAEKMDAKPTKLFTLCSLLMALIFAYSTSVQFNDSDWYFWIPLYASACVVHLMNMHYKFDYKPTKPIAKLALCLGIFLFIKVVLEDFVNGIAGFWSLDLRERVVREKIGSGLVVISMLLHLEALSITRESTKGNKPKFPIHVEYGEINYH
ncbi:TMEM220 protein [Dillenia turbinata]|uniref:TMEM220 protein n=1 Tax=Dillenia turbinata TaxID=194707 RepID=A0AAN8UWE1_9MAGN